MAMQKPVVHIPKPCPASWQDMAPNATGRHCSSCDKTVVDFTSMNDGEIKHFFSTKKQGNVCGRFNSTQVLTTHTLWQQRLLDAHAYLDRKISSSLPRYIALMVIATVMFLSGCTRRTTGKVRENHSSIDKCLDQEEKPLLGDTVYVDPEELKK